MFHNLKEVTKSLIKRIFEAFGLSVSKYSEAQLIYKIASASNITMFIDIGANEGKVTTNLIKAGYKGKVVCIEPLEPINQKLFLKFSRFTQVKVLEPLALDRADAMKSFQRSENLVSSSLKIPNKAYLYAAPGSRIVAEQLVKTRRLDSVLIDLFQDKFKAKQERIMLKIDVQGSELKVLKGFGALLSRINYIIIEATFIPDYKNQVLYQEIDQFLNKSKFKLVMEYNKFFNKKSKYQSDLLYEKR